LRHKLIISLVRNESIHSQDELRKRLLDLGVDVTQATLSRDIKTLGLVRVYNGKEGYIYKERNSGVEESLTTVDSSDLIDDILDIQFSGNLAVIKTKLGYATGVAFEIDRLKIPEVIGTVGGDDTILVILKEGSNRQDFLKKLERLKMDER